MFYVASYGEGLIEGEQTYRYIGWTTDRLAAYTYNVAGKKSLPFYEHYVVFEYPDMPNCDFIEILEKEWDYSVRSLDCDDSYICIYDTPFDDYISLSQQEYRELILEPDICYQQGRKHMYSAYEYAKTQEKFIRSDSMNKFIREIFARYCEIFKGYQNDPFKVDKMLSGTESLISQIDEDELPFY